MDSEFTQDAESKSGNVIYAVRQNTTKSCTFNLNIVNKGALKLSPTDLKAIEYEGNKIFQTAGHNLVVNQPDKATTEGFNFTLTIFERFPRNYPATASRFPTTLAVTPLGRESIEYPGVILPGPAGAISRLNIRNDRGYGRRVADRVSSFSLLVGRLGAHEYLSHYLLGFGDHPIDSGITKEFINYNTTTDLFIAEEAKKFLDATCQSGRLP
jgi:hypothetical protein